MRKRPTETIVTGVVAVAIIVGQLATTVAATNGRLARGSLTGTWSGTYRGAYHGTFTLHWTQSKSRSPGRSSSRATSGDEHHGRRARQDQPSRNRRQHKCDHVLRLGIRKVDVGHLQGRWRRRLVARTRRDPRGWDAGEPYQVDSVSRARASWARERIPSLRYTRRDLPRRSCASRNLGRDRIEFVNPVVARCATRVEVGVSSSGATG